jgi:hypothetical protein
LQGATHHHHPRHQHVVTSRCIRTPGIEDAHIRGLATDAFDRFVGHLSSNLTAVERAGFQQRHVFGAAFVLRVCTESVGSISLIVSAYAAAMDRETTPLTLPYRGPQHFLLSGRAFNDYKPLQRKAAALRSLWRLQ